eukprot:TRINITY_DN221_c0_g1_i8.p2 TRINITY_DN221_c0_g1~~TRINITY_DN221_c0_g1_i8.p2  ORF type:complete len:122 (-),score=7.81 TRINITY_DN221_c0_g1_i8:378-743(-)
MAGELKKNAFSFVGTLITLQHMMPPLQKRYIGQFCQLLEPEGLMVFQVPTFMPNYEFDCSDTYEEMRAKRGRGMEMHAIRQVVIFDTLDANGCVVLESLENDMIGVQGAQSTIIIAVKARS